MNGVRSATWTLEIDKARPGFKEFVYFQIGLLRIRLHFQISSQSALYPAKLKAELINNVVFQKHLAIIADQSADDTILESRIFHTFSLSTRKKSSWFNLRLDQIRSIWGSRLTLNIRVAEYPEGPDGFSLVQDIPDIDQVISKILQPRPLDSPSPVSKSETQYLCAVASEIFLEQPNLLHLDAPLVLVGDLHGRYNDLLRIFETHGYPDTTSYLFLGDYVDRGRNSIDIMLLLLCYKIKYPGHLFIIRGNHENEAITKRYGFYDECKRKGANFSAFLYVFDCMPLAAIVGGSFFCVHGGISPSMTSLDDISKWKRPCQLPKDGVVNDLVWADATLSSDFFTTNLRGTSTAFGPLAAKRFLDTIGCKIIVRAHEVNQNGFVYPYEDDMTVVTLFSAPDYYNHNLGATMVIMDDLSYTFSTYSGYTKMEEKEIESGNILMRRA